MAFNGNFMCTSFKKELLEGGHDFKNSGGDTFKIALYTNSATFTAATTDYTTGNEVSNSGTYSAGGGTFTSASITARGALIYNTTEGGATGTTNTIVVLDFGADKTSTAGDFQIAFPAADASNAIIRVA